MFTSLNYTEINDNLKYLHINDKFFEKVNALYMKICSYSIK